MLYRNGQADYIVSSSFLNTTLRGKKLGPIPSRMDRAEGAVRHRRRRWDRHWAANLTRVRFTFECVLSRVLSLFLPFQPPASPPPPSRSARADTRYSISRNFTCVSCQTVSLRNRCTRHRHSHSGETKLPSSNTVDSVVDS